MDCGGLQAVVHDRRREESCSRWQAMLCGHRKGGHGVWEEGHYDGQGRPLGGRWETWVNGHGSPGSDDRPRLDSHREEPYYDRSRWRYHGDTIGDSWVRRAMGVRLEDVRSIHSQEGATDSVRDMHIHLVGGDTSPLARRIRNDRQYDVTPG